MKTFKLFKRDEAGRQMDPAAAGFRDRPWHFKFEFRRQPYVRCLHTADQAVAQTRARALYKEITEAIITGQFDRLDATKSRQTVQSSVAALVAAYRKCPVDASLDTREGNINALINVLKKIGAGEKEQILAMPYPLLLTAQTAANYFALVTSREFDSQAAEVTFRRTLNSLWSQAASICAPRAIAFYKSSNIYHKSLDEFANAGVLHRFTRLPKITYNPPADEMIDATLQAWANVDDRNLFLAIGHELAFGLRIGEVVQARTSWWTTRNGYPVLDGSADVKNGTGIVQVRALDPFYTTMRVKALARHWLDLEKDELIITGSDSFRDDGIEREVSAFLRSKGWETKKTNHALRAYAGSQVAMRYGIYEAQTWLRHSSVKVTEGHYSHFIRKFKPADLEQIPTRWAILDQAPDLKVVQGHEL